MKRTDTARLATGVGNFAAMVGHELNNIAVPLEGYAELATEGVGGTESGRYSLEEMRTAIARIKDLASDLESLAEPGSPPTRVAIGDCMPEDMGAHPADVREIDWRCDASTLVTVDRSHARRAIRSLGILATPSGTTSMSRPTWEVLLGSAAPARCAVCGAGARLKDHCVLVQAHSARALTTESLLDPFGPARAGRLSRRLTLAVLVHSVHSAGGHVFLDEETDLLRVAFPAV